MNDGSCTLFLVLLDFMGYRNFLHEKKSYKSLFGHLDFISHYICRLFYQMESHNGICSIYFPFFRSCRIISFFSKVAVSRCIIFYGCYRIRGLFILGNYFTCLADHAEIYVNHHHFWPFNRYAGEIIFS